MTPSTPSVFPCKASFKVLPHMGPSPLKVPVAEYNRPGETTHLG